MKLCLLRARQVVPAKREDVFPFFADAHNLEEITPDLLRFRVLTPKPIAMGAGTLIDYRLRLRKLPLKWRTLIAQWEPPYGFVDMQLKGPYRHWHHRHTFDEVPGGTLLGDDVFYAVGGGPLAGWIERKMVRSDVEEIFRHRQEKIAKRFGGDAGEGSVTIEDLDQLPENLAGLNQGPFAANGKTPVSEAG